ncbi:MAG: tetratricopeptide repeat protein [Acidobacteriia bacterium]|nr:tetratricopeptide repeat protein [Terriglobia bacterium]
MKPSRPLKSAKKKIGRDTSPHFLWLSPYEWLIVLAALLCDINSWGHQFLLDDIPYIVQNSVLESPKLILKIFASPFLLDAARYGFMAMYRPLTALTFAVNVWLGDFKPDGFHLVNRVLHVLICLIIYRIVIRLIPERRSVAVIASLLFAVHPVQTEAVTYITGRADVLAMLFFLVAWLSFLRLRSRNQFSGKEFALSLLCYLLSLLSKEDAITWLGVILLTEWVYHAKGKWGCFVEQLRQHYQIYGGYVGTTLLFLVVRSWVLKGSITGSIPFILNPLAQASIKARLLTGLKIMWEYIGQFFWPAHFLPDYSYNQIPLVTSWISPTTLLVIALSLLLILVVFWFYQRCLDVFFGLGFFCITYSVVSNIFIPIGTIRADRLLYMPAFGWCLVVAVLYSALWTKLQTRQSKSILAVTLAVIVALLAGRTIDRNRDWQSPETLYLQAFTPMPNSSKLLNSIGTQLLQQGRSQDAIACFQKALAIGYFEPKMVQSNLGAALKASGDWGGALEQYDSIISKDPTYAAAYFNRGNLYLAEKKYAEAVADYKKALVYDPQLVPAEINLKAALERLSENNPTKKP